MLGLGDAADLEKRAVVLMDKVRAINSRDFRDVAATELFFPLLVSPHVGVAGWGSWGILC